MRFGSARSWSKSVPRLVPVNTSQETENNLSENGLQYRTLPSEVPLSKSRSLCFAATLAMLLSPFFLRAQSPQHPLDGLRTEEYWTVYDVVQASGHLDEDTHFASVLLHEPAKDVVLAWKTGEAVPREANVTLMRKGKTIEARVDIAGRKLEFWKEIPGAQAPIFVSEILGFSDTILADERVKKALAKRGITDLNQVECASVPLGYFAFPEQEGHRIAFADCDLVHGAYHSWGRSIAGLTIEVDLGEKKILQVFDDGPQPFPGGPVDFEEAPEVARPGTKPGFVTQPAGPSFEVNNGEVSWQNWRFRFRLDSRSGLILDLVRVNDGGRLRSVMYEGMVSELFVPYMDETRNWSTRVFIDNGEFFPGGTLQSMREGLDCPANAVYFDGISTNEKGFPVLRPGQACLFEKFDGDVAWRHGDDTGVWGRPTRSLVLRSAALIGNYDYLFDWTFAQDGSIHVAVGATGIIESRSVAADSVGGMHGDDVEKYGQLVAKNVLGVNHDHFFSYRLDLDVDGQDNSFMVHRLVRKQLPEGSPRKSIWVAEPFIAKNEHDAMMDIHLDKPTMWVFVNPNVKGPLGHAVGYEIMPGVTAASLLDPDDGVQKAGAFSNHQLWVTPYCPDERYAGGTYVIGSKGTDGLATWTKKNRKIENTDIVAWYTLGFHHVPREEDWPVMPTMWHEFTIRPFDFFPQNPVLDLPHVP
jgi:primary-amine oxidase